MITLKDQVEKTLDVVQEASANIRILSDYSGISDSSKNRLLSTAEHLDDLIPLLSGYYMDCQHLEK